MMSTNEGILANAGHKKQTNLEKIVFIACIITILIMRLMNLSELYGPIVMFDEAGYWSHAANLAGLPWKEVVPVWYSYGYSLLLLPLFFFTHDMVTLYRMAIVENAVLGVIGFILGIKIFKEIQPDCNRFVTIMISFVATSYSAYISQSQIAWSETFVYTWFLFVLYLCIGFLKRPDVLHAFLFSFSIGFLYIIHNRTIAIMVALALLCILLFTKKHINLKTILVMVFTLVVIMVLDHFIKIGLSELMWGVPDGFSGNDFASQEKSMKLFFSAEGIIQLCISLFGKLWYVLVSTLLIGFWGIIFLIRNFINNMKKEEQKIKAYFCFFTLLCVLGTIAVSTIGANSVKSDRLDYLFYGRYSDMVCGILILLGLLYLQQCTFHHRYILEITLAILLTTVSAIVVFVQTAPLENTRFNTICVPGIYFQTTFHVQSLTCIAVAVAWILFLCGCFVQKVYPNPLRAIAYFLNFAICCLIFFTVSNNVYYTTTRVNHENLSRNNSMYQFLDQYSDVPIYTNEGSSPNTNRLRTQVEENIINYFSLPDQDDTNHFLLTTLDPSSLKLQNMNNYYAVSVPGIYVVLAKGDELINRLEQDGYSLHQYGGLLTYDDVDIDCPDNNIRVSVEDKDEEIAIDVQFISEKLFLNSNNYHLAYHIYDKAGTLLEYNGRRTDFLTVYDGQTTPLSINPEDIPDEPGKYILEVDVVHEGVTWLSDQGLETEHIIIEVISYDEQALPLSAFHTKNGEHTEQGIRSNSTPGHLVYGNYMPLSAESYTFHADMQLEQAPDTGNIGYVDVVANQGMETIAKMELSKSDFAKDGTFALSIPVMLYQDYNDVEFRVYTEAGVSLLVKSISLQLNETNEQPLPLPSFNTENGEMTKQGIRSNSTPGHLVYGNYMPLSAGSYTFHADMQLEQAPDTSNIGYVDVVANQGMETIAKLELSKNDFTKDGTLALSIPVMLYQDYNDVEFRVYTEAGVSLLVKSISLQLNETNEQPLSLLSFNTENGEMTKQGIRSTANPGYLIYGNYMPLSAGSYTFHVDMKLERAPFLSDVIGHIDIVANQGQETIAKMELLKNGFTDNDITHFSVPIDLLQDYDDVELRIYTEANVSLLTKSTSVRLNEKNEEPLLLFEFHTENGEMTEQGIRSTSAPGYLVYGNYMSLPAASYTFHADMQLEQAPDTGNIGYIDVVANQGMETIAKLELSKDDFTEDGTIRFSVPATLQQDYEDIEFRVYTEAGTILLVKSMSFTLDKPEENQAAA